MEWFSIWRNLSESPTEFYQTITFPFLTSHSHAQLENHLYFHEEDLKKKTKMPFLSGLFPPNHIMK